MADRKRLTFEELAELEPRLRDLMAAARAHRRSRSRDFCANAVWYGYGQESRSGWGCGLREELCLLVGHGRQPKHPVLSTREAYDVAYTAIYHALPDCRHEGVIC